MLSRPQSPLQGNSSRVGCSADEILVCSRRPIRPNFVRDVQSWHGGEHFLCAVQSTALSLRPAGAMTRLRGLQRNTPTDAGALLPKQSHCLPHSFLFPAIRSLLLQTVPQGAAGHKQPASGTCINTRRPAAAADRTSINLATRRRLNSRPMTANRSKTALPPAHPIAYHLPSMRHFWSKVACPQRNSVQQPKTGTMAFEVLKFNWQVHTQPRRSNS